MNIYYQSSMPRSGSTLLQNILAQNPDFYATPTSGMLELLFGARANYTNSPEFKAQDAALMRRAFYGFCRAGMEGYFRALTDKPCVIDKSRGWGVHFPLLTEIFEREPKIICMVRDLRQVVASMEKRFRQNPDKHQPLENHVQMTGTTTFKRAAAALVSQPVGLALDRLLEIHQRGYAEKILFLRFEDLTRNPDQALDRVYDYFGRPSFKHDFSCVDQITHEDDAVYGIGGLHDIRLEVRPVQEDYQEVLGSAAVAHIEKSWAWYFQRFGYALSSS